MLREYKINERNHFAPEKIRRIEEKYSKKVIDSIQNAEYLYQLVNHMEFFKPIRVGFIAKLFGAKDKVYNTPYENFVDILRFKAIFHNERITKELVCYIQDLDKIHFIKLVQEKSKYNVELLSKPDLSPYVIKDKYYFKANKNDLFEYKELLIREMVRSMK